MRAFIMLTFCLLLSSCDGRKQLLEGRFVDLSHAYDSTTVYWPTEKGFVLEKGPEGTTPGGWFYSANRFWTPEHGGTHIDAPIHFAEGKDRVDEIPLERLIGHGVVVDVSGKCRENRDYLVQVGDFISWEGTNGKIPEGTIVLLRTGFSAYWPDRVQYMGTNERGPGAVSKLHFPGLDSAAADWLVTQRKIKAVGLDTPSIDHGQSTTFSTHVTLFKRNVPAFENVMNLDQLPAKGFTVVALPMKIKGGSGGPLRIVAVVPS